MKMFRVCWESLSGTRGKGQPITEESARAWMEILNMETEFSHWLEPCDEETEDGTS